MKHHNASQCLFTTLAYLPSDIRPSPVSSDSKSLLAVAARCDMLLSALGLPTAEAWRGAKIFGTTLCLLSSASKGLWPWIPPGKNLRILWRDPGIGVVLALHVPTALQYKQGFTGLQHARGHGFNVRPYEFHGVSFGAPLEPMRLPTGTRADAGALHSSYAGLPGCDPTSLLMKRRAFKAAHSMD